MHGKMLVVLVAGLLGAACDSGGGGGNGPAEDTAPPEDTTSPECTLPDLTGKAFRIIFLASTEPTDVLNPTFELDIAEYVNVIIFHVVEHNVEEGYITMTAGPCSTEFEDPDATPLVPKAFHYAVETIPFRVNLDGCRFDIAEAAVLDMMFATLNKPYRIDRLFGSGVIKEDLSGITEGHLEGGITLETTLDLCTTIPGLGVVNFHWFMNLAHICPNMDVDEDGTFDAYYFKGTFDATDVTDLFVPGDVVPIVSLVDECPLNDDECVPVD